MLKIVNILTAFILQALYGGMYACWHVANDGTKKVFWSNTLDDAMEWAECCLNDETVKIVRYDGELIAIRYAY